MTQSPGSDQTSPNNAVAGSPLMQGLALAQVLAARLSHDLAGLVGTITGTLELAEGDPEALAMARDTAAALQARLQLIRAAFGHSEQDLSFGDIRALLNGMPLSRRVSLRLEHMPHAQIWSASRARLLLCTAMLGVECLAGQGELVMQQETDGTVLVAPIGPRAIWPAGFATYFTNPCAALEHATDQGPRGILAPLVALLAQAAGARITLLIGPHAETAPPLMITFDK